LATDVNVISLQGTGDSMQMLGVNM